MTKNLLWMIMDDRGSSRMIIDNLEVLVDNDGLQDGSQRKEARRCWSVVGWSLRDGWLILLNRSEKSSQLIPGLSRSPSSDSSVIQSPLQDLSSSRSPSCSHRIFLAAARRGVRDRSATAWHQGVFSGGDWWWDWGTHGIEDCAEKHQKIGDLARKNMVLFQLMGTWLEYDGIYPPVNNIGMVWGHPSVINHGWLGNPL